MAETLQRRLALKLKLHKLDNCGIAAPILLNELLAKNGHTTKLVQGYSSFRNETCWHVWVEVGSEKCDIGYTIACLHEPEFVNCKMILHTNLHPDSTPKNDQTVIDQWEMYQNDHKAFWNSMPTKLKNFRAACLAKLGHS
jgi:hypothetical protein